MKKIKFNREFKKQFELVGTQFLLLVLMMYSFCSCVNTKKSGTVFLRPSSTLYSLNYDSTKVIKYYYEGNYLKRLVKDRRMVLNVTKDQDYLFLPLLKFNGIHKLVAQDSIPLSKSELTRGRFVNGYAPYEQNAISKTGPDPITLVSHSRIVYTEQEPFAQAISILIKYRPSITVDGKDYQYSAASSFNAGFAFGIKRRRNWVRNGYMIDADRKVLADSRKVYKRNSDFSYGIFAGPTVQKIEQSNMKGVYASSQSILGINYGAMFVVGINRFNAGLSVGFDSFPGKTEQSYIYNHKPWLGLVVAFDFFGK